MEIKTMSAEELEERKMEIRELVNAEDADLDALEAEAKEINAELEERRKQIELKTREAEEILRNAQEVIEDGKENKPMTSKEIRSSKEYMDAYVRYLKGMDKNGTECRALLSENAPDDGMIPVPVYVEGRIQTAWERDEILSRIRKTYLKGNVKIGVEMAATPAGIHEEGAEAPPEEELTIAVVEIVAKSIKKWIFVSDEVLDLNGEAFLDYIYDEIEYQIVKAAAYGALSVILQAPDSGTGAPIISATEISALNVADIVTAIGQLSGGASDIVFIANRATIAAYQALALGANYAFDIFAGATVIPTDLLVSYDNADEGETFAIVGDLKGVQGNFPAGDSVKFTFDPYSHAEEDLVKIVGRMFAGFGLVKNNVFTLLQKPQEENE